MLAHWLAAEGNHTIINGFFYDVAVAFKSRVFAGYSSIAWPFLASISFTACWFHSSSASHRAATSRHDSNVFGHLFRSQRHHVGRSAFYGLMRVGESTTTNGLSFNPS